MDNFPTVSATDTSVYTDIQGLARIKALGRKDEESALVEVARQFEAIFIQMMLGTMREASLGDDLFDSQESQMYRDMFDKQIALTMASGRGIGLAEQMVAQLRRARGSAGTESEISEVLGAKEPVPLIRLRENAGTAIEGTPAALVSGLDPANLNTRSLDPHKEVRPSSPMEEKYDSPASFVRDVWPHAQRAAEKLGVDPRVLVAQAVLETGWGQHIPMSTEGESSYNIFGIKSGNDWNRAVVQANTTEFYDGIKQTEQASFRSYDSLAAAFEDYVNLIKTNPRYQAAQGAGVQFINLLQQGGYATDPDYAIKINRIMDSNLMRELGADFKA